MRPSSMIPAAGILADLAPTLTIPIRPRIPMVATAASILQTASTIRMALAIRIPPAPYS